MPTTLITGASSGLGAEMARQLADLGHDLALCARRTDRLDALRDEILAAHPDLRVSVKALDVTDHDAVFGVFEEFAEELGGLDKVIVNAGLGKGQPLGTGRFDANKQTAETNFIGALAQTEAAATIFRRQDAGHLVMVSSFSALRGMPRNITTYAATKAAVAHLAEGFRADVHGTPIKVTVLYPGYIVSEMSGTSARTPLMTSTEKGVRSMVETIVKEKASARVPAWPWAPLGFVIKHVPVGVLRRMG
ncbi:SDR family oxidoreductase [Nocardioides KLBMP 9356]|uniref:SDR family oxidoreductase n=1 Tax=Nocardioides potassii TaxID=2911371 RepID=A0ABS9HIN0_9ACTN|nr:SDR family oxidoreductase [Nocardioides potassii]MCF6379958.1 SDR family oxidoreductase [Nocardioides potassii]